MTLPCWKGALLAGSRAQHEILNFVLGRMQSSKPEVAQSKNVTRQFRCVNRKCPAVREANLLSSATSRAAKEAELLTLLDHDMAEAFL